MCWQPRGHVQRTKDLDNFTLTSSHLFLPQTYKAPGGNLVSAPTLRGKFLHFLIHFLLPASVTSDFLSFMQRRLGCFQHCFSGCRLREICRLPMLHGPSGYSQPCAGAAFLSAHSLCRGSAQDTLAALVSSSTLLPELHPGVSVHVFRMPRDSDQVSEHQLHRVSEAAA